MASREIAREPQARLSFRRGKWAWQDAVYGAMILASVVGLIYALTRR
jgi:energy-coupling factor transporter transmembrane protein EcfT